MVAGGVQSVEEGALYATHTSYYPQFYSTLLPPAPPGSYSSSNYSSSTYSSSGQSSDYSWLKLEGAPGGCRPSTPGRTRHPKCTCPSPEALRQARRALAARRVQTTRDPRCTCPSPTLSRDPSPWGGASPSPPSTPATASPPPRHPRCTCPEPDLTLRLSAARRARSARDLRCTCPPTATPTPTPTPPPPSQEPTCTCQPPLSTQPQQPLTRRASKNRLVHAVLLNSPGNTAISTEHGDFVPLSDAPTKISESPNLSKARAKARKPKEKNKTKGSKSEEEVKSGGEDSSQPASPARRVKDKLCHLRHKVVSGVAALTSPRPPCREGEAHGCRCDISSEGVLRVRTPGSVTRVLPPPTPTPTEATPQVEERCLKAEYEGPSRGQSFPVEDLPQPILEGVCSPLGEVPPLSPPEQVVTPFLQQSSSSLSCSVYKTLPDSYLTMEGHRSPGFPLRGLRDLQRLSASHGHLYSPESTALSRTKSLELYEKDSQEGETESSAPSSRGSVIHLPPTSSAQCWTKKILPQSPECNSQGANDTLYISSPCISSTTNVSTAVGNRISGAKSLGDVQDGGAGPDYENVVFHDSGRYVMLSKRLLDKWQLSYEACLPPDHALMQHQDALHGEGEIPTVKVTENIQVSTALPCDERESDNVALTQTPPSATSVSAISTTSTTATHRTSQPTLLSTSTHTSYILTSPSPASYSSPNQSLLDMTLKFPDVPPRLSIHPPAPPSSAVTSLSTFCSSATTAPLQADAGPSSPLLSPASTLHHLATQHVGGLVDKTHHSLPRDTKLTVPKRGSPRRKSREEYCSATNLLPATPAHVRRHSDVASTYFSRTDDGDTDQETDRLLGQQRSDDPGFYDEKGWRRPKTRTVMPRPPNHKANGGGATSNGSTPSTPIGQGQQVPSNQAPSPPPDMAAPNKTKIKKEKETNKKKGRSKEVMIHEPAVLIEGVLFRARYLGSTQLVSEGQPTKTTRMMQAEEAVSRIKDADDDKEALAESNGPELLPGPPHSPSPKHSPLSHQSPASCLTSGESDSLKEFLSRNNSPQNLNPPITTVITSKSLSSPLAHEQMKGNTSPSQGRDISSVSSEAPSQHGKVWKPGHRLSQGVLTSPYVGQVNLAVHPNIPIVAPLPPGVLEEPIRNPENRFIAAEVMEVPTNVDGIDVEYEDEGENEDEAEEECRKEPQVKRTENDGNEDDDVDDDDDDDDDEDDDDDDDDDEEEQEEEEEEEDEDEDEGGDKHSSVDSEDQCIEVLTVLPTTSGGAQQDGNESLEVDGGGGSLDWVSEEGGGPGLGPAGTVFHLRLVGSVDVAEESGKAPARKTACKRPKKDMVMEAVSHLKALAPDGESQPSTEVDLFISTEKIMVLNTDLKEIMMDHALRTISYIADIGDLVVLMARRRVLPTDDATNGIQKTPKMICHVFESDEAQFIAQSIGQAFQVAYLEFLKANGIEDHSFVKEMDYQEVLNSQEIFGDELQMFAKKELQKEELYISKTVVVPKMKSEILGVVVVESGWGSMVPTVVIANLSPTGAAAKCGQLNIGDQIIAINGVSLVGLPLSTCQNYIKNTKYNTAVKLTVVPCPPVVEVKIRRPDTKYQLGFSVQNGVICSLLRGGIAERGGVRVGHRIIDINSQSVVAVPHEKIVNLLATSVGEIRMKTMPTSIFRLLTGQETPQYI
ncbi:uncharacterized protein LOC123514343 isoform X13 [Portunus trituberculatus]|uniref:uncharacterized protein LOC123514343 isoform X13 n=1 Tax=Portunus trituberculatus TaxID=210409 RepID=UPI001E1CB223|nr:uncharacterized protein LOC123514343 isoform X13 [Portunus trituberculatus]